MREFELIERLGPYLADAGDGVAVGHGDDAAVLDVGGRGLAVTVDVVVDGVHFRRDVSSLQDVGWKVVAVNVSDLAAMGARPTAAVVGLARPPQVPATGVERLYEGMAEACRRWGLRLVGGDTVAAPVLSVSLTALGEVPLDRVVTRGGARPGDRLVVVGQLGGGAAALAAIAAGRPPDPVHLAAHRRPVALVEAGTELARHGATALIDVSDGLGADLGRLCAASGVGARIRWEDLPLAEGAVDLARALGDDPVVAVCSGGEDFALLAAVPGGRAMVAARAAAAAEGVPAAVVGDVVEAPLGVRVDRGDGTLADVTAMGYDHFGGTGP